MPITRQQLTDLSKSGEYRAIFFQHLGWDASHSEPFQMEVPFAGVKRLYTIDPFAQKCGFVICLADCENFPHKNEQAKLVRLLRNYYNQNILILRDKDGSQKWLFAHKLPNKQMRLVDVTVTSSQTPDVLISKFNRMVFHIDQEEGLNITDVVRQINESFARNAEVVTRQFYNEFRQNLKKFQDFIVGLQQTVDQQQYAALMLNRLMFVYFIQHKGFLDNNTNYLKERLQQIQQKHGRDKFHSHFYRHFLLTLFHRGLGTPEESRDEATHNLIGRVPYLNGGLFDTHQIEHGNHIDIPDEAFEKIFTFFDKYQWHLDTRPEASGSEINPDVIGYIFEKYINDRAAMGAYYTQEDITGYIARNTILPCLLQKAKEQCREAFNPQSTIWRLLRENPDQYIYDSVRHGCDLSDDKLPPNIAMGLDATAPNLRERRAEWNERAPEEWALPTETWREVIARRTRYFALREKIRNGEICRIEDLTTHNLDIEELTADTLRWHEGSDFITAFFIAIAGRSAMENRRDNERRGITVLDPACGSGAFLFAALNVLEPLYEICIDRMEKFVGDDNEKDGKKHIYYRHVLKDISKHGNQQYWVYRSIILNNLFGVDIMPEAAEVAKLRLFLKLAAVAEPDMSKSNMGLEPLPDIDFNIRDGNALVGFASWQNFQQAATAKLDLSDGLLGEVRNQAEMTGMAYRRFIDAQTVSDIGSGDFRLAKSELKRAMGSLTDNLDMYLAHDYGQAAEGRYNPWRESHKPFHWFAEFYEIMENGGFDVVIGNPPYVEYVEDRFAYVVRDYKTLPCRNLYAYFMEFSQAIMHDQSCFGMIVPLSLVSSKQMSRVQKLIEKNSTTYYANFSWRPGKLFDAVNLALTISLSIKTNKTAVFTSGYQKWYSNTRDNLISGISLVSAPTKRQHFWVPKQGHDFDGTIMQKVTAPPSVQIKKFVGGTKHKVFYRSGGGLYWKVVTDFLPKFRLNGSPATSSKEARLFVNREEFVLPITAVLSSNTFWFYYTLVSDLRDLRPATIELFPIRESMLSDANLISLSTELMVDMEKNSSMKTRRHRASGVAETQSFTVRKSKHIIDQIDAVLAKHYGLTEEELDYIINYDIKYRMGGGG